MSSTEERHEALRKFMEKYPGLYEYSNISSRNQSLEYIDAIGHQMDKMLKMCTWQNTKCSETDFKMVYNGQSFSKCYAFNADQERTLYTKLPGSWCHEK